MIVKDVHESRLRFSVRSFVTHVEFVSVVCALFNVYELKCSVWGASTRFDRW